MKTIKFKIPLFNWEVCVCHKVNNSEINKMKDIAIKFGLSKEELSFIDFTTYYGMHHFFDGKSFIWTTDQKNRLRNEKVLRHELRHLEDRVLQHYSVNDIEMAAILSEFIEEQTYNLKQEKK